MHPDAEWYTSSAAGVHFDAELAQVRFGEGVQPVLAPVGGNKRFRAKVVSQVH